MRALTRMGFFQTRKVECTPGKILRKGYTRKNTGKHVKPYCIRSTSRYTKPAENTASRQQERLNRVIGSKKECPPGKIARSAYVRRITSRIHKEGYNRVTKSGKVVKIFPKEKSVFVKAACVKDVGKPGKLPTGSPKIGPLRKGELKRFGYSYKLPETERRAALQRAIQELGPLDIYRKLDAVSKLTVRTSPQSSSTFASDRNWVRKTYAGANGSLNAF